MFTSPLYSYDDLVCDFYGICVDFMYCKLYGLEMRKYVVTRATQNTLLKLIYSKKATKIWRYLPQGSLLVLFKPGGRLSQIFVAFSENLNFILTILLKKFKLTILQLYSSTKLLVQGRTACKLHQRCR